MTKLNKNGREIWFKRVLWSYWPCHWKGLLTLIAAIGVANGLVWLSLWAMEAAGHPEWRDIGFASLPLTLIVLLWITLRHS